jgi:hypothetical protein
MNRESFLVVQLPYFVTNVKIFRIYKTLSKRHDASWGYGWKRRPSDVEDGSEYTE